jgi:hypothetical protein
VDTNWTFPVASLTGQGLTGHMSTMRCPVCGEEFELQRAARGGTPTCSKAGCRKKKQRMGEEWEDWVVMQGQSSPVVKPPVDAAGREKRKCKRCLQWKDGAHVCADGRKENGDVVGAKKAERRPDVVDSEKLAVAARGLMQDRGAPRVVVPAGDVNALAREVVARVPAKKLQEDTIEARLVRLEAALKQYAKKTPDARKGGES